MSAKERERMKVFELVIQKHLKLIEASKILSISYRQTKRIIKRYKEEGEKGLIHKNRGRLSNRKFNKESLFKILELYRTKYMGFGPTLASEKLSLKDGIKIDHETLRRVLIKEGLWEKNSRRQKHRRRGERKYHFGEMIQMDGSHHKWFGDEGGKKCLINMVDDATNTTLSIMDEEETTKSAMFLLWEWVKKYGIPFSLYCDRKNVYITEREASIEEQLEGKEPKTAFGLACEKLGIKIITAYSAQAKGRIERNHGLYQDRFVKELRLEDIKNIEDANKLLKSTFIDELNKKFSLKPKEEKDFHRPLPNNIDLRNIFCYEHTRVVANDYVVRFNNKYYQILKENKILPKTGRRIKILEWLDGSIHIYFNDKELKINDITDIVISNKNKELVYT